MIKRLNGDRKIVKEMAKNQTKNSLKITMKWQQKIKKKHPIRSEIGQKLMEMGRK